MHIHTYSHTYSHLHTCRYICTYTHIHTHTQISKQFTFPICRTCQISPHQSAACVTPPPSPPARGTHIYTHIHTYAHIHTCTHIHTFSHIHTHIHTFTNISKQLRHTWICRAGSWYITTLYPGLLGSLSWQVSFFVVRFLANIHFFGVCIHHVMHQHVMFCSTSYVLFTFRLPCKYIVFSFSFKNVTRH